MPACGDFALSEPTVPTSSPGIFSYKGKIFSPAVPKLQNFKEHFKLALTVLASVVWRALQPHYTRNGHSHWMLTARLLEIRGFP
jgi:hypothetical protein